MAINLQICVRREEIVKELGISRNTLSKNLKNLSDERKTRLKAAGFEARCYIPPAAAMLIMAFYREK